MTDRYQVVTLSDMTESFAQGPGRSGSLEPCKLYHQRARVSILVPAGVQRSVPSKPVPGSPLLHGDGA